MANCRIGMAMNVNVQARIDYWKKREGYNRSKLLTEGHPLTYGSAQAAKRLKPKSAAACKNPAAARALTATTGYGMPRQKPTK